MENNRKRINYFKTIIKKVAEQNVTDASRIHSLERYMFYDALRYNSSNENNMVPLMTLDDMKLYIIAWKQMLPLIEKMRRKEKHMVKQYQREDCKVDHKHNAIAIQYLYDFRHYLKNVFRRKNGYRKPLSDDMKKYINFYDGKLNTFMSGGEYHRSVARNDLMKVLDCPERYEAYIIAWKKNVSKYESRIWKNNSSHRHIYKNNLSFLYMIRRLIREKTRNHISKNKM